MFVFVVGAVAADDHGGSLRDGLPFGAVLAFLRADFQVDGAGVVGDGHGINLAEVTLDLGEEDIAPDHALAALAAQIFQRREIFRGEHLAVEDRHRLVRQVEALHLDRRCGILFLELDDRRRNLAFQFFFQLPLFSLADGACQGDFGFDAGVRGNAFRQQLFKAHILQELRAVADADGDILPDDADLASVKKAVDGYAIPFHILHQVTQNSLIHRRVPKEVVDFEFKALIVGLKRSQQPRTQSFIQRSGTLQGEDHLTLLPQHPGMFDDDTAKTGRESRVRHELRP